MRSLAIQNSLRNGEAQNLYVLGPPTQSAHNQPRRFEEHYKTAGLAPLRGFSGLYLQKEEPRSTCAERGSENKGTTYERS